MVPGLSVRRPFREKLPSSRNVPIIKNISSIELHHTHPGPAVSLPAPTVSSAIRANVASTRQCGATTAGACAPAAACAAPPQPRVSASTPVEIAAEDLIPVYDLPIAPSLAPRKTRNRRRRRAAAAGAGAAEGELASHEITLSDDPSTPPPSPRHPSTPHHPTPTTATTRPLNTRPPTSILPAILFLLSLTVITVHLPRLLPFPHPPLPHPPTNPLAPLLSLASSLTPSPTPPPPPLSTPSPYPIPPPTFLDSPVRISAIIPHSTPSPFQNTPWGEVMPHIAQRLAWTNSSYSLHVIHEDHLTTPGPNRDAAQIALRSSQIVLGTDLHDPSSSAFLQDLLSLQGKAPGGSSGAPAGQTVFFLDSDESLMRLRRLGGEEWAEEQVSSPLDQFLPWRRAASARKQEVVTIMEDLWHRNSSEDLMFAFLVLIHEYVMPVPIVASSANGMDLQSLICIGRYCGSDVLNCVNDPTCKKSLDCLQSCAFNDQVCQYRCIVSYETPALGQFSLCILQLHNCRRLSATPPALPDPAPMPSFQGAPITHEAAEKVLRGWLGETPVSWLVAAGKNPAYDYFPCQHQLFFPGKARGAYWYEPVFKVKTLDDREVWRRRRYRVRRGKAPGTFHLTVLDNGVTSNEFWRLLDASDDMAFSLFYYSGAASAAGLAYSGAVLATPAGAWPAEEHLPRIEAALERAGIKLWELSNVDNTACEGAPLDLSEEAVQGLARFAAA